jgi:spermidine/putrescine transport system substrate-binding protein
MKRQQTRKLTLGNTAPQAVASPISRRSFLAGATATIAAGLLGAAGCDPSSSTTNSSATALKPAADGNITWFTYAEYVDPKVVAAFEKTYNVTVDQVFYTNAEGMVQKVAAGLPYDLITTNSAYNQQLIAGGLLRSFDPAAIKNFDQIVSYFAQAPYDGGQLRYSIPYGYGPAGIAYEKSKVSVTGSWSDLWNNPGAKGKIYVLDQQDETLGMSLIRDKASVNSVSTGDVTTAVDNLLSLKPALGGISSDIISIMDGGEAWLAHAWAGSVYQALTKLTGPNDWGFEWPQEGLSMGCDTLSVGTHAKSPGTALLFMQFLLEQENSHANTLYTGYSNGTQQGDAAYQELTKDYPFLAFPDSDLATAQWRQAPTGARLSLWNQQWSRFKG